MLQSGFWRKLQIKVRSLFIKQDWNLKAGHDIEPAFFANGRWYYKFITGYNAYYERYMASMDRIAEMDQRVDKKYLDLFLKTMTEYLNKGDLVNLSILKQHLEDRRKYLLNVELLYNLASVWYFDKSENPYTYNYDYADKKIALWRQDKEALAFFLKSPLVKFMPPHNILEDNIQPYLKAAALDEIQQLSFHLQQLLKTASGSEAISMLKLRLQELEASRLIA